MKRLLCLVLSFLLVAALFSGCSTSTEDAADGDQQTPETVSQDQPDSEGADTHVITDMTGRQVELPVNIERVVNNWPSSNSTLILIGAGHLLVGSSTTMTENEWARLIYPGIADVPVNLENVEDILRLEPDVVMANRVEEEWINAGLPAVSLMYSDYDTMKESMIILGEILGGELQQKCLRWNEYVDEQIAFVTARLEDIPEEERPVVHYVSANTNEGPAMTGAKGSIFDTWTTVAGGIYAAGLVPDTTEGSQQVEITEEALLATDPDIIVVGGIAQAEVYEELLQNQTWADITAVREGRVYYSPIGIFPWCRFGMESAMQIVWAAKTFYPDLFEDVDMHEVVRDFYQEFAGVDLTDSQIDNMLEGLAPNA